MYPKLLHLYGSLAINTYGVCIAVGVALFTWLMQQAVVAKKLLTADQFSHLVSSCTIVGVLGGRALYVLSAWNEIPTWFDVFALWNGGFAVLGSIIAIVAIAPWYSQKYSTSGLALLDIAAIYAPLLESIGRIGCFFAGCCYGIPTDRWYGIIYTNPEVCAPLGIALHPTQLYASAALLILFFFMRYYAQFRFTRPGSCLALYLMLTSLQRFVIDFLRADHGDDKGIVSFHQMVALALALCAGTALYMLCKKPRD